MSDEDYELGIVLLCSDCGCPAEVVVYADLTVSYECPECDQPVDLPTEENLGFH